MREYCKWSYANYKLNNINIKFNVKKHNENGNDNDIRMNNHNVFLCILINIYRYKFIGIYNCCTTKKQMVLHSNQMNR